MCQYVPCGRSNSVPRQTQLIQIYVRASFPVMCRAQTVPYARDTKIKNKSLATFCDQERKKRMEEKIFDDAILWLLASRQ